MVKYLALSTYMIIFFLMLGDTGQVFQHFKFSFLYFLINFAIYIISLYSLHHSLQTSIVIFQKAKYNFESERVKSNHVMLENVPRMREICAVY